MCPEPQIPVSRDCPPENGDVDTRFWSRRGIKITQHLLNGSFSTYHGYGALRYPPEGISYEYPRDPNRPDGCNHQVLATTVPPAEAARPEPRPCESVQPDAQVIRPSPHNSGQSLKGSQNLPISVAHASAGVSSREDARGLSKPPSVPAQRAQPGGSGISSVPGATLPHVAQSEEPQPPRRSENQERHSDAQPRSSSPSNPAVHEPSLDEAPRENLRDRTDPQSEPEPRPQPGASRISNASERAQTHITQRQQPLQGGELPKNPEDQAHHDDKQSAGSGINTATQSPDDAGHSRVRSHTSSQSSGNSPPSRYWTERRYNVQPGVSGLREVPSHGSEGPPRLRRPQYHAPTEDDSSSGNTFTAEGANEDRHSSRPRPDIEPLQTRPPRRPSGSINVPGPVRDPARDRLILEQLAAEDELLRSQSEHLTQVRNALQRQVAEQSAILEEIYQQQDASLAARRQHFPHGIHPSNEPVSCQFITS